jgi:hypothetical protein
LQTRTCSIPFPTTLAFSSREPTPCHRPHSRASGLTDPHVGEKYLTREKGAHVSVGKGSRVSFLGEAIPAKGRNTARDPLSSIARLGIAVRVRFEGWKERTNDSRSDHRVPRLRDVPHIIQVHARRVVVEKPT